jgi:hypothetical protein
VNPLEVDHVLEVPAHEDVDARYGRDRDVLGVCPHTTRHYAGREVRVGK